PQHRPSARRAGTLPDGGDGARMLGAGRRRCLRRGRGIEGRAAAPHHGHGRQDTGRARARADTKGGRMSSNAAHAETMRQRLIVGLDVATVAEAEQVVRDLDGVVSFYKVGYQLAFAGGLDFARELAAGGTKVFLDMKLLDIDNTVAKAVE